MEGLYVNPSSELILVCAYDDAEYVVYQAHEDKSHAMIARVHDTSVTLDDGKTEVHTGHYDGKDCITWDGTETWKRVQVSATQVHVLAGHRRYIPMTLVALRLLKDVVCRMFVAMAAMWTTTTRV